MHNTLIAATTLSLLLLASGCTEERRNELAREADNIIGEDMKVSYIDHAQVVKTWTVKDGKITTGKDEKGNSLGYYYFWSEETGYVQVPVAQTVIEEIK